MKAALKQKWIDALRSGEFTQGIGSLKKVTDNLRTEHCCLGVLRECAGLRWRSNEVSDSLTEYGPPIDLDADGYLHVDEANALGLPQELVTTLASMNDGINNHHQHSFSEIALHIEATVPVTQS